MTPVSPPTISSLLWEPALGALKIPILDQSSQYSSFCATEKQSQLGSWRASVGVALTLKTAMA